MDHLALLEIKHTHGVVTQLGDEQPSPARIDCHVIDPAADLTERNFGFQCQDGPLDSADAIL